MIKILVNKYTKEVEMVSNYAEFAGENVDLGGRFLAGAERLEIHEVDSVPNDFTPYKYLYKNGTFELNAAYIEPEDVKKVKELESIIEQQQQKIQEQDEVINALIVDLLMG